MAVLPVVTGRGYKELDIADGKLASILFEKVTYSEVPNDERDKVRSDLEKYCALDTQDDIHLWVFKK